MTHTVQFQQRSRNLITRMALLSARLQVQLAIYHSVVAHEQSTQQLSVALSEAIVELQKVEHVSLALSSFFGDHMQLHDEINRLFAPFLAAGVVRTTQRHHIDQERFALERTLAHVAGHLHLAKQLHAKLIAQQSTLRAVVHTWSQVQEIFSAIDDEARDVTIYLRKLVGCTQQLIQLLLHVQYLDAQEQQSFDELYALLPAQQLRDTSMYAQRIKALEEHYSQF